MLYFIIIYYYVLLYYLSFCTSLSYLITSYLIRPISYCLEAFKRGPDAELGQQLRGGYGASELRHAHAQHRLDLHEPPEPLGGGKRR